MRAGPSGVLRDPGVLKMLALRDTDHRLRSGIQGPYQFATTDKRPFVLLRLHCGNYSFNLSLTSLDPCQVYQAKMHCKDFSSNSRIRSNKWDIGTGPRTLGSLGAEVPTLYLQPMILDLLKPNPTPKLPGTRTSLPHLRCLKPRSAHPTGTRRALDPWSSFLIS